MKQANSTHVKRKALLFVLLAALLLTGAILLRDCAGTQSVSTPQGREAFLRKLGWEIDLSSEDVRTVQLPQSLDGQIARYNEVQLSQGYDLSSHLGEQCKQYCYLVTNYPSEGQTVLATLYVQGDQVIAGDLHSTALDGFLHGLHMTTEEEL